MFASLSSIAVTAMLTLELEPDATGARITLLGAPFERFRQLADTGSPTEKT
jgi:hypothetical protein